MNLIANQLIASPDNTLNTILNSNSSFPELPDGVTFTKWNGSSFLPSSTYNAANNSWSINYSLTLGEGGYFTSSLRFTNVFLGSVGPYLEGVPWTPNYADGLYLISDPIPRSGNLTTMFTNVVGRLPEDGEWVSILDRVTQTYNRSTYSSVNGWLDQNLNPSTAILRVGEAAWFNLGPVNMEVPLIPEPGMLALWGLGAVVLFGQRSRLRRITPQFRYFLHPNKSRR